MKIILAFSKGGHYLEMQQIMDAFKNNELVYVTSYAASTKNLNNAYFLKDSAESLILNNIKNIFIFQVIIIIKERPDVIISTGADITISLFVI